MSVIEKAKQRKALAKITVQEEIYDELVDYLKYLGYDKKRETEGIGKVMDGALTLLFKTEKRNEDYKRFKEGMETKNNIVLPKKAMNTSDDAVEGD